MVWAFSTLASHPPALVEWNHASDVVANDRLNANESVNLQAVENGRFETVPTSGSAVQKGLVAVKTLFEYETGKNLALGGHRSALDHSSRSISVGNLPRQSDNALPACVRKM